MPREWSPRWAERRIETIKKQVEDWLKENKLSQDAHVFTREEWKARGEKYGDTAVVTIAAAGPFYHAMNYPEDRYDRELAERFTNFLEQLGLWFERGYAWTWHLYPTEESGPVMGDAQAPATSGKTILHLLGELAFPGRKLVLTQGDRYFRIEDLIAQARRDAKDPRMQATLAEPIYSAGTDSEGKVVIWRETPGGKVAHFVEVHSKIKTEF